MTVAPAYYSTSLDHVLAELERVDLLVRIQVWRARQAQTSDDGFQGLYISEQDVDDLLAGPRGMPPWAAEPSPVPDSEVHGALERLGQESAGRKAGSAERGIALRLQVLESHFGLSPWEVDALLVCLAPELDLRYERLYAYLQDDVTKTRPSADLVLNILCPSFSAKLEARSHFLHQARLFSNNLLQFLDGPAQREPTILGQYLKVDPRVVNYLLGSDHLDEQLSAFVTKVEPQARLDGLILPSELERRLSALVQQEGARRDGMLVNLQGAYGAGKRTAAEALCVQMGLNLLDVSGERLMGGSHADLEARLRVVVREAVFQNAALFFHGFDTLTGNERSSLRDILVRESHQHRLVTFVAGETPWEPTDGAASLPTVVIEFPPTTQEQRARIWELALAESPCAVDGGEIELLANAFRLTGGQIMDAAATARQLAQWRDPGAQAITPGDLYRACRMHSSQQLGALAQKVPPNHTWDDIVLPDDRVQQLREICDYVRFRGLVYDQWGFEGKQALGKGLNVLFAGPSGTGKTMAAGIMAGELGLDLYKIDLSMVVSKFIGETEKNLAKVFAEAETSNAILFFDEADALFGKRTEVRDSHDRYANIEISYLLQRMEEYDGVVILATNLRKNMDDAFVRRMHFMLEFPLPTEEDRRRIWRQVWPGDAPRSPELDLDGVARRFELSGGNIRNIALAAAFLAAADGGVITQPHLTRATRREYQKMGRVLREGEFKEGGE